MAAISSGDTPDPRGPGNYAIDGTTGERINRHTGERESPAPVAIMVSPRERDRLSQIINRRLDAVDGGTADGPYDAFEHQDLLALKQEIDAAWYHVEMTPGDEA